MCKAMQCSIQPHHILRDRHLSWILGAVAAALISEDWWVEHFGVDQSLPHLPHSNSMFIALFLLVYVIFSLSLSAAKGVRANLFLIPKFPRPTHFREQSHKIAQNSLLIGHLYVALRDSDIIAMFYIPTKAYSKHCDSLF